MQMKNAVRILVALIPIFLLSCSDDPDVFISVGEQKGKLHVTLSIKNIAVQGFLIDAKDTIARYDGKPVDGNIVFSDVPFGRYYLVVESDMWIGEQDVYISRPLDNTYMEMSRGNRFISAINIGLVDTIKAAIVGNQNYFGIYFSLNQPAVFAQTPVSVTPANLADDIAIDAAISDECAVNFPVDSLFSQTGIVLTLRYYASNTGSTMDSIVLPYVIDSAGYDSICTDMLIYKIGPRFASSETDANNLHLLDAFHRESDIMVSFRYPMDKASVESNISMEPHFAATLFWSENTLTIVPANALLPDTTYTITLGTSSMTADSMHFKCPYSFKVETDSSAFFSDYWPLDSTIYASLTGSFAFQSNYFLEPEAMRDAFSIVPQVDSLVFTSSYAGKVSISHAALLPATTYQITIDGSLMSRKGIMLGSDLVILFSTSAL